MQAGKRRQKHSSTGGFGAAALGLYLAWQFQITDRNIQEKLLVNNPFFFFLSSLFPCCMAVEHCSQGFQKRCGPCQVHVQLKQTLLGFGKVPEPCSCILLGAVCTFAVPRLAASMPFASGPDSALLLLWFYTNLTNGFQLRGNIEKDSGNLL